VRLDSKRSSANTGGFISCASLMTQQQAVLSRFWRRASNRIPACPKCPVPMLLTTTEIMRMPANDRLAEALRRSMPLLPGEARTVVVSLVRPETIAIIGGTVVAWAGAHAFGVGEIVDVLLLGVGYLSLGLSVFQGATELFDFIYVASGAQADSDFDQAAKHFAAAVSVLGISVVQTLLLLGRTQAAVSRKVPKIQPRVRVPAPEQSTQSLTVARPSTLPGGILGRTGPYGAIEVARNQSITEQRITLMHELAHRYFSPRTGPMRKLRAEARLSLYSRSALLRYLEEALAEGYGQFKVHGLSHALRAYRFPVQGGYVTVAQLGGEGQAIGAITVGGALLRVTLSNGQIPVSQ